jgi:ribosome-associated toxin RatA of RatAB toxin-antitoxin module
MRHLEVAARVHDRSASEIYATLCDFESYPLFSKEVRSVRIDSTDGGQMLSSWETNFRGGILRWVERDFFHPDTHTITFEQVEGDTEHFAGRWAVEDERDGGLIRFDADFDMGIPSLSSIIDPIAEQALRENIVAIIKGLFGLGVEVLTDSAEDRELLSS